MSAIHSRRPAPALLACLLLTLFLAGPSLGLPRLLDPLLPPGWAAAWAARTPALGLDLAGGREAVYRVESPDPADLERAATVLRRRLDLEGVAGATVQPQARDQLRVQVPCQSAPACQQLAERLELTDLLALHEVLAQAPSPALLGPVPGTEVLELAGEAGAPPTWLRLDSSPAFTGASLAEARVGFEPRTGAPGVELEMTRPGAESFRHMTRRLAGRPVAMVLGGRAVSVATIEGEIPGGRAFLRGAFELEEARRLTRLLGAGALPAPLTRLAGRGVGPQLGADSLEAGMRAAALGLAGVAGFMTWRYGRAGLCAALAVAANLGWQVGALGWLRVALTLPGLAGVALTVGMGVDACILVIERIREEAARGRSPAGARAAGLRRAWPALLDSVATSLLTAGALWVFGSGPVRGFAVTLALGLACSLAAARGLLPRLLALGEP